ncbi:PAS domain S-box protein [Mucilaginibacter sp. 10I4]|uniref:sensor histidine kinase n=1 Tax=Mucilaginibacter sp. 10I4 TaxID=3048580 RepID=UPI002B228B74|nr:PAS domain S-box protein [Mucilaginibacter sp. 10I4]MEB0264041.1 PAS domain S-box protein [Mucilaginibacter sp. 10I4]
MSTNENKNDSLINVLSLDDYKESSIKENNFISKKRYHDLIDSINDIIFQTDNEGNWTFLNSSWEKVLSYEVKDVIGKPFFNYLHPDDIDKNFKLFEPLIQGKKNYCSHEIRYLDNTGKIVWMSVYAILLKDNLGNVIGTSGTLRDITLDIANRDTVKLLSDNINDLICLYTIGGEFIYLSPSIQTITDYYPADLIGKSAYDFCHPDDIEKIILNHKSILTKPLGETNLISYRFLLKKGSYTWLESNSKLIEDVNGLEISIVSCSRVINDRIYNEQQLLLTLERERELNQLKSDFINFASHQFRSPLACIRTSVELIEMALSKSDDDLVKLQRHTENVFFEVDKLSSLMNEILTVGKLESQSLICKKEPLLISDILKQKISSIERLQDDLRKIDLKINNDDEVMMVDPFIIDHILDNFLSNAFKYSKGRTRPQIIVDFCLHNCNIKIKDFGIGIPLTDQKKIFQAFYRADNVTNIPGTGLGLFITKSLLELHGGNVSFISRPNKWTEFTLILPKK